MNIIDTFICHQSAEIVFEDSASAEDKSKAVAAVVTAAAQAASAGVRQQKPGWRTFALSASPLLVPHGSKTLCMVTVIVALVPDEVKQAVGAIPWRTPGPAGSTH